MDINLLITNEIEDLSKRYASVYSSQGLHGASEFVDSLNDLITIASLSNQAGTLTPTTKARIKESLVECLNLDIPVLQIERCWDTAVNNNIIS